MLNRRSSRSSKPPVNRRPGCRLRRELAFDHAVGEVVRPQRGDAVVACVARHRRATRRRAAGCAAATGRPMRHARRASRGCDRCRSAIRRSGARRCARARRPSGLPRPRGARTRSRGRPPVPTTGCSAPSCLWRPSRSLSAGLPSAPAPGAACRTPTPPAPGRRPAGRRHAPPRGGRRRRRPSSPKRPSAMAPKAQRSRAARG